jgi:hypothetical protein
MSDTAETSNFTSAIFGETRTATEEERDAIQALVADVPVAVFQELNARLNARGLVMAIMSKDELQ